MKVQYLFLPVVAAVSRSIRALENDTAPAAPATTQDQTAETNAPGIEELEAKWGFDVSSTKSVDLCNSF